MKTRCLALVLLPVAAGLAMLATPLAAAPSGELKARKAIAGKLAELRDDLALTQEQKEKVRGVLQAHKSELKDQWVAGKNARGTMHSAVKEHGADSPEARTAADSLGRVSANRALLVAEIAAAVRPVLTPDQIKKLESAKGELLKWIEERSSTGGI